MPSPSRFASRSSISVGIAGATLGAVLGLLYARRCARRVAAVLREEGAEREAQSTWLAGQLVTAEQDERRRLSLALHDGPLQALSGIVLMHDAGLRALADGRPEEAERIIRGAVARERETIQALRDLSFAMEPIVLRDHGFEAAVVALADQLRAAQRLELELDVRAGGQLGAKAQVALYQTLREALGQAARRRPAHISVAVEIAPDGGVVAMVTDDGVDERRRGNAEALEERSRILQGRIDIQTGRGTGTLVRISLPSYTAAV